MKKSLICALLALSFGAQATCYKEYLDGLESTKAAIENSNIDEARKEGMAIAGGLALTTTSTATGGSMAAFSTISAQFIAAIYTGTLWVDLRVSDDTEQLLKNEKALEAALSILKEARIGNGPYLQGAMPRVWRDVSNEISLRQVAAKVLELDRARAFCPNGEVASPAGILNQAVQELKR